MPGTPNITNWPSGLGRERVAAIIDAAKSAPLPCPRTYLREPRTRMVAEVKAARGIERSYAHAVSGHPAAASRSSVTWLAPRPVFRELRPHRLQGHSIAAAVASWSRFSDRPT